MAVLTKELCETSYLIYKFGCQILMETISNHLDGPAPVRDKSIKV